MKKLREPLGYMMLTALLCLLAMIIIENFPIDLSMKMVREGIQEQPQPYAIPERKPNQNTVEIQLPNGKKMLVSK